MLVSIREGTQLLKFLPVLLYYGVDNAWGRYTPKYLAGDISAAYVKKEVLNTRRTIECTCAGMVGKSPDVQFGI